MSIVISLIILGALVLILEAYKERQKTEQIKDLSKIPGITPDEIVQIINKTKV